jgi:hypothetical protein
MLAWSHALARMPQEAQLDGEAEPVDRAPFRSDECQVIGAQYIVPGHFGRIGWNGEQPDTLFGRQQSTTWHGGLESVEGGRS